MEEVFYKISFLCIPLNLERYGTKFVLGPCPNDFGVEKSKKVAKYQG
jgi:hypothetical protein